MTNKIPDGVAENEVFDDSPERASNNGITKMSDWEATDLLAHIDECTKGDTEFYKDFTHAVFEHFGWKYFEKDIKENQKFLRHSDSSSEAGDESWDEKIQRKNAEKRGLIAGYKPNLLSKYLVLNLAGRHDEMIEQMWKDMEKYKI